MSDVEKPMFEKADPPKRRISDLKIEEAIFLKNSWLLLSAFGIAFAIISATQDLMNASINPFTKIVAAIILGAVLYVIHRRSLNDKTVVQ